MIASDDVNSEKFITPSFSVAHAHDEPIEPDAFNDAARAAQYLSCILLSLRWDPPLKSRQIVTKYAFWILNSMINLHISFVS